MGRGEACGTRQLFLFSYFGCFLTLWLWCELLFLPLSLPPLLFFGSRSIFRAAKTENPASSSTGSPSSKYENRRASALLRNTQNIRICMGKKPIVSVTYENERISIKNSLPYLKCVLRLSCVVHGPIYGRFMGFYVNGFLSV